MTQEGFNTAINAAKNVDYVVDIITRGGLSVHLSPDEVHNYPLRHKVCDELHIYHGPAFESTCIIPKGDDYLFIDYSDIIAVIVNSEAL